MGQYYHIVNIDKRESLNPHILGDGLKLMEFASGGGTMTALAILLSDGNGRGGGDFRGESPRIGSWAGDRIVIAGDYADPGKWGFPKCEMPDTPDGVTLYAIASETFEDISEEMREVICQDPYVKEDIGKRWDVH